MTPTLTTLAEAVAELKRITDVLERLAADQDHQKDGDDDARKHDA
jgi:hypothetical protein